MSYAIKKLYGIETGPYDSIDKKETIVVVDLVNYVWHRGKQLHTAIADPYVVYRGLSFQIDQHERRMMRLSEFKQKYTKHESPDYFRYHRSNQ